MATYEVSPVDGTRARLPHPLELVGFALIVVNVVALIAFYVRGSWLATASNGTGNVVDFVTVWAAGRETLLGHAATVYDWSALKAVDESIVGPFRGYLGWSYPPTFLFVAASLALLPYISAFALWVFGTFALYLAAIRGIVGDRVGYFLAAAFPALLANFMVGQNGFLSASLIGGALMLLESKPMCAGVLIGLLTFKPQLGLLFPIALMAGSRWRVLATATIVTAFLMTASATAFGIESWRAFFAGIGDAFGLDWFADQGKLQSVFGFVHAIGASKSSAWIVQIITAVIAASAIGVLWQSRRTTYPIKAAALGIGVPFTTSHLYAYDLVILAIPIAFLFRIAQTDGFLKYELLGIGLACLLILVYPFVQAPVGLLAALLIAALVARRAMIAPSPSI
jgi:arabinofuranan 3-O-arabinosyltransferase